MNEDFENGQTSLQEYRKFSENTLYSCCNMITLLKGKEGIEALFSLIIPFITEDYVIKQNLDLNQPKIKTEYILQCEALIFSARSLLDYLESKSSNNQFDKTMQDVLKISSQNINFEIFDPYLIEIIKRITLLPQESILVRSSLQFIKAASKKIKKCIPESINEIIGYCLNASEYTLIEAQCEVKIYFSYFLKI